MSRSMRGRAVEQSTKERTVYLRLSAHEAALQVLELQRVHWWMGHSAQAPLVEGLSPPFYQVTMCFEMVHSAHLLIAIDSLLLSAPSDGMQLQFLFQHWISPLYSPGGWVPQLLGRQQGNCHTSEPRRS